MYGQMTAGSWIYIGSQGIVQGTYETFVEMGRQHLRRPARRQMDLHGRARRHGRRAAARGDHGRRSHARGRVPPGRIAKRLETRYLDVQAGSLDEALAMIDAAGRAAASFGRRCSATSSTCSPDLLARGIRPDA